jgi:adenine deaminase
MANNKTFSVSGNIVDVVNQRIFKGTIHIENGKILSIKEENVSETHYIIPGFVDSHIHIESSMLIPSEFARIAVTHGTVATVSDPHEIANVLGIDGINFMISNGKKVSFKFYFGVPSCVPATAFETSGAHIDSQKINDLLKSEDIFYLAEMMNFPGVLFDDAEVMKKIAAAKKYNKPVDGHAPGLKGNDLIKYANAGISTDHECFTLEEAMDKINNGMKIQIREGSAAKNFDELIGLMDNYSDHIMFCSDDKHPDDLLKGHINLLVKRAISKGYDPIKVLRTVTCNPVLHYKLDVGLLQVNHDADFIIVDNLKDLVVQKTFIKGEMVAENGKTLIQSSNEKPLNLFKAIKINEKDIAVENKSDKIKVIKALEGQLITETMVLTPKIKDGFIISDTERDILKIVVLNRYQITKPAVGFIHNFKIKKGAIASTVAHDSHNIIAVGASDNDIIRAINLLIDSKGGISLIDEIEEILLPLPVAGIMSNEDGYQVAEKYELINAKIKAIGSGLKSPYMTLSFMALLVIPELKLSDKGLFDGTKFAFTSIYA